MSWIFVFRLVVMLGIGKEKALVPLVISIFYITVGNILCKRKGIAVQVLFRSRNPP